MLSLFTATKHSKRSAAIGAIVAIALGASTVIVAAPAMAVANDGSVTVTSATPVAAPTSTITLTIKVHCPDKGADSNNAQSLTADITSSSGAGASGIDVEGTGVATPPNDWTLTADVNTPDTLGPVDYTVTVSGRLCVNTPKSATVTVLVAGLPDAPSNLAADVTGDSTATVSFTPPADNGSAITVYEWTIDGGQTVASAGATSPIVITGLPNGIASPLQLRAVNGAGPGAWSAPINVTPVGVPEPVTNLTAIANDRSLDVSFNAPVSDGGFAITTYEYSIDGGAQFTSWASTLTAQTISGLTNGTSYAVVVRARNSQGGGKLSATVNATPVGVPDSPTNVQAVAGDKSVTVSFTPPASNGGLPITEYRYSTDGINFVKAAQSSSPITITTDSADGVSPLVNLTTYTVQIVAVNALGPSAPSTAVPATPGTTVPDAPIVTAVLHGDSVLGAMFTVGSAGGLPITDLQYRIGLAGLPTSTVLVDGIAVINGLTNGTSYDVYLRVGNANGYSAWSNVGTGTPSTTAGPPTITSIAGADAALVVSFTAPADNGSASISDYEYSTDAGATWLTTGTTASPITISNASDGSGALSNSQTYQVLLRAVNLNGSGLPSNQVAATPLEATTTSIVCAAATYTGSALTPCTVTVSAVTGLTLHPTASYSNNTAAGTATASYTYPGDSTHLGSTATVTFTIAKASSTSTVTCNPSTITYTGSAFTPCSVSVTGAGGLNTTGTVVYSNNTSAGTATASYDYPGDSNHNVSTGSTTFTIAQAAVTVTASTSSITYPSAAPTVTFTTNPALTSGDWTTLPTCDVYASGDTGFATPLSGTQNAGTYATHCSGGVSVNYAATYTNGTLTITKANATVIADTTSITYGTDVPAATFTTSPSPITWTAQPTCATYSTSDTFFVTPLTGLHSAGTYITHCTGGTSVNYAPTAYTNGVLTISQANATVIAASPSITYGASVPAVSFTTNPTPITWTTNPTCATYSTSDTGFTSALTGVHSVGTYVTHCTGGASVNYAPTTYTDGVLTISQANATVIAASPSITYGTSVPAVSFTTSPTPITWITDPTCSVYTTADTSFSSALAGVQDAGTYLTHCTGGTSVNYTPTTYTNGVLTITKANATVIAASPSINYGFAVPAVTFTTSPTPITWTTNPTCGVYATTDTGFVTRLTGVQNAGTYVTHCSGGVSANYTPTAYTSGSLTINKANVTVTASSPASITYGSVVPSFSFGTILTGGPGTLITGIAWTPAPVCGVYATSDTGYATRLAGVQNAGSYVTHCSGGTSANYAPNTYVDGTFTINKAPATVTATPASSSYDVGVPSLTFTSSPTPISWITPPTCSAYATADSGFTTPLIGVQDVGSYATQCSGGVSVNYAPNAYGPATLTITKANATVIASSPVSIDYGFAAPAVTFTTSPTPITWTTEPTCGVYSTSDTGFANRLTGVQNAGTYVTHCSGGVSANYSAASFTSGSLTINKANVTITASSPASITFGANVSSVSYGTSPSPITWTSPPACGVYATTDTGYVTRLTGAQNAGAYVTHCSGGTSVNYAPNNYIDGRFTINTALATVSATAASVAYGTSVPSVSFTTVPTPIVWDTTPTCAVYASSDTGYAIALTGVQDAGSYVAHCAGAASSNFISPSYVDSNFTVTKAAATVNASSPSTVIHGVDVSSVTFTTSPSPIAWETEPTCAVYASTDTRFASPLSGVQDAGTYVTHCSGGVSLNYAPNSYIAGSFTIGKDSVEVTATSPADTIFGATLPTVSTTTNPTPITWTAAPTCGIYATTDTGYTTRLTGVQPAGSYVTHCSAGVSVNYAPSAYVDGALNIVKAPSVSTITCPTTALIATGSALAPCSVTITGAGGLSTTGTVVYANNTSAGTATADYTYAGDVNHDGSTAAQVSFTIVKVSTVTRPTEPTMKTSIASRSALKLLTTVGSPAASLATTTPAVCVVKGSYVYFLVAGTCKVTVKQGGLVWKSYQTTVNPKTVRSTPTTAQKITSVLFAKGSSTLSAAAKKQLTALVTKFKAAKVVFVYGFVAGTVSSGTTAQKSLSLARANAVARYLISKGVTIVSAKGYGRQIAATPAKPTTAANDRADLGTA